MKSFGRSLVLAIAVAATTLTAFAPAQARDRDWRRHRGGDAAAIGALGLATGVILGGALANQNRRERVYVEPEPDVYIEEEPEYRVIRRPRRVVETYEGGLEPWTRPWYRWCSNRYQSFNADTGTFRGYDGRDHFCTAG
ncbi:BA14K family protein [Pararhizobium sp.]|uniref:BA14K family protein n=1 Tax=Pararhizobium sp. TaxID=1977563 RepID=UPI00271A75C6|nr:BA14K family protein [Pararhizobium sp.]MDO9414772.1 BA14K family protein [Pararhizobium sp.]